MKEDLDDIIINTSDDGDVFITEDNVASEDNNNSSEDNQSYNRDDFQQEEPTAENKFDGWNNLASYMRDQDIFHGDFGEINSVDDFNDLIRSEINQGISDKYKMIEEALQNGVPGNEISKYEQTLNFLYGITDDSIQSESDEAMDLRKNIIYQDYVDRGFSHDKAVKMVDLSVKQGMDIQDAQESLEALKNEYSYRYNGLIENAKRAEYERQQEIGRQTQELQNRLDEEDNLFGGIKVTNRMRQNAFDALTRPVDRSGMTSIQRYMTENTSDFWSKIGLIYAATDGFRAMDKIFNKEVERSSNKRISDLEASLFGGGNNNSGAYNLY